MNGEKNSMRSRFIIPGAFSAASLCAATIASAAPLQKGFDAEIARHARTMLDETRKTFRYDIFGSETFCGDALQLHKVIAGEKNGGIGLKADADALPVKKELMSGPITCRLFVLHPVLKAPAVVSSFDNVAKVCETIQPYADHLGIDKITRPFSEGETGRHVD
jgi:hypothetical protein